MMAGLPHPASQGSIIPIGQFVQEEGDSALAESPHPNQPNNHHNNPFQYTRI